MAANHEIRILVTTAESRTGDAILAEFDRKYAGINKINLTGVIPPTVDPRERTYSSTKLAQMDMIGGDSAELASTFKSFDTVVLIPPATTKKLEVGQKLINVAADSGVKNVVLLSDCCAGLASDKPRFGEFLQLEKLAKGKLGNANLCIVRAGHYMQNLFLYAKQMKETGRLGLPIGDGKFSPVDCRDVGMAVLTVATSGKEMDAKHRHKIYCLSGPESASGPEIVEKLKQAGYSQDIQFADIPEEEARKLLSTIPGMDPSEVELILQDFQAVREGKVNVVFKDIFDLLDEKPTSLLDFLKEYKDLFENPE